MTIELICDQTDCPIASEGRCLEGFPEGEGCPHLRRVSEEEVSEVAVEDAESESVPDLVEAEHPEEKWISLAGGQSLSASEAGVLAQDYGAHVVLVAGEFESGKTTLIVELYGRFLIGPFDGWEFGGSRTLIALDSRHLPTRHASHRPKPTTDRTQEEHEGLLHLRLFKDRQVALFFTDLRGERFEHVTDGALAGDEIPFIARANRALVLVDGEKVKALESRQEAIHRARLLIGGLTENDGLPPGIPLAIILTKDDLVDDASQRWFQDQAEQLREFADRRGVNATIFTIAARPDDDPDNPRGLESLLQWMCALDEPSAVVVEESRKPDDRLFLRFGLAGNGG